MGFLNPQSWVDVDGGGNPLDWSARQGKLLYPAYEMLRLALVERCTASSTSVPVVLQTARAPGRIYIDTWFASFHSTMSTLITAFVNHTDNGGNWNGIVPGSAAPVWTEAAILTAIGDASRVPIVDIPTGAWSLQQYKILNKLLWTKKATFAPQNHGPTPPRLNPIWFRSVWSRPTFDAAWARLLLDFPAAWVVNLTAPGVEGWSRLFWVGADAVAESVRRTSYMRMTIDTGGFNVLIDWYSKTFILGDIFEPEGLGWVDGGMGLGAVETVPAPDVGGAIESTDYFLNVIDPPGQVQVFQRPVPDPAFPGGSLQHGWQCDTRTGLPDNMCVVKWNVTGGFLFV